MLAQTLANALESTLRAIAGAQSIPGFVAAIVENGALSWSLCHGVTDLEAPAPVTLDTRFPLASVTKVVTAAAIHARAARGGLSAESTMAELLPDVPWTDTRGRGITLLQLLSHTGGLGDYDPICCADDAATDEGALDRAMRAFAALPLASDPGNHYSYSNGGYDTAGLALARAAGTSYEEAARALVLDPLGMATSSFYPHPPAPTPAAVGHLGDGRGGAVPYRGSIGSRSHSPSGTLASTARDVSRLVAALSAPEQSPVPGWQRLASKLVPTDRADDAWMGHGVRVRAWGNDMVLEHGGWDPGFRCAVAALPYRNAGALVLTNFHWSWPGMMECILDALQGVAPRVTEADLALLRAPPPAGRGTS